MAEHLYLKWGTLKAWEGLNKEGPTFAALKRYHEFPVSMGAAQQRDTPEQKQALCDAIDGIDGEIINDWTGEPMTKDEAKTYVRNYDERPQ